jgi:orotidine-5'-phosphate decarboxylase
VVNVILRFNRAIVEATKDLACAYKPNVAFYEAHGKDGLVALRRTIAAVHYLAPEVPVILDAKRGDIGSTNVGYAEAAFEFLQADAITVHPYLGAEALQPFLARAEKGIIVLCRTSNPGAGEFQNLSVNGGEPLYRFVARRVASEWNKSGNCALVVGATYPDELREVRGIVGDMPILIPGIGAQGGDVEKTVSAGKDSRGQGMIINSSRGIIFASKGADFAEAARREVEKLRDLINQYR